MRDVLEERLTSRLRALGDTVHDELPPPADLELQVARRRRRTRAQRRWSSLAVAAVIVAAVAAVAVVRGTAGSGPPLRVATSPTSASPLPDSLQPGTVMLSARGNNVISLDAQGHQNATMVTVKAGDDITYARATDDHRTIWYLSLKHGTKTCGDVVRANIDGNSSKIITQAVAFDVSPDGTRLALYGAGNLADGQCTPVKAGATGEIAVVDVATFESSTLRIGGVASLRFAPDGSYLVAARCAAAKACDTSRRIDVPSRLGAALVSEPMSFGAKEPTPIRAASLAFGRGAMFVLEPSPSGTIYRYDPTGAGPAAAVFAGNLAWDVTQLVPTTTGIDVVAARMPPVGKPPASSFGLYRVEAGRLVLVRLLVDPGTLTDVRPLARG